MSGKIQQYQYDETFIKRDPDRFDEDMISMLKEKHVENLNAIFSALYSEIDQKLLDHFRTRIERHVLPALTIADSLGSAASRSTIEELCICFVKGFSLPILILDAWIDEHHGFQKETLLEAMRLIYEANLHLNRLPKTVSHCFNANYVIVTRSIQSEYENRFMFYESFSTDVLVNRMLEAQDYFRSICRYFIAIVSGTLESYAIEISEHFQQMLALFGILRQVADEIADVEEDLKTGVLTIPVLFALEAFDFSDEIKLYWDDKVPFSKIRDHIVRGKGFQKTFELGIRLHNKCKNLKENLVESYPFLHELFVFYDLKYCLLHRLYSNNWLDNKKTY